jgi:hypothetical protein
MAELVAKDPTRRGAMHPLAVRDPGRMYRDGFGLLHRAVLGLRHGVLAPGPELVLVNYDAAQVDPGVHVGVALIDLAEFVGTGHEIIEAKLARLVQIEQPGNVF